MITCKDRKEHYDRQATLPRIGWRGQSKLAAATVVVVGCGELGAAAAGLLARVGVGCLHLVDDGCREMVNLSEQTFFDRDDVRVKLPKALVTAEQLRVINPTVHIEPVVTRLTSVNADELLKDAHLILDGTDSDVTRHVINKICLKQNIPWVFATVVESHGLMMNIVPGKTHCFACVFGNPGRRTSGQSPEDEQEKGKLSIIAHVVASFQVGQAIKLLLGDDDYSRDLLYVDAWNPLLKRVVLKEQQGYCSVCGR